MILTFAGNRLDEADRTTPRFPVARAASVATEVRTALGQRHPTLVVGAAASGADLIVLEEAREMGIACHVVLPLTIDEFRRTSVADQGPDWVDRFDRTIGVSSGLTVDDLSRHHDWYLRGNELIVDTALRLANRSMIEGLVVAAADDDSVSNDFARLALERRWPITRINPLGSA